MALTMKLKVRPKSSGRLGCSPSSLVKLIYFSMNYWAKDCGRSSSVVLLLGNYVLCIVPIHMIPSWSVWPMESKGNDGMVHLKLGYRRLCGFSLALSLSLCLSLIVCSAMRVKHLESFISNPGQTFRWLQPRLTICGYLTRDRKPEPPCYAAPDTWLSETLWLKYFVLFCFKTLSSG